MARTHIRRKKKDLIPRGRLDGRLRGTKYAGSRVGPADDRFEREADVTANRVVSGAPLDPVFDSRLDPDAPTSVYRSESMGGARSGERLPHQELSFFKARMGFDFSHVRIKADAGADTVARSINAKAYTRGAEIGFQKGEYQPGTMKGRSLLAHELTHVIQQGGGSSASATGAAAPETHSAGDTQSRAPAGEISAKGPGGAVQRAPQGLGTDEQFRIPGLEKPAEPEKPKKREINRELKCERKFLVKSVIGNVWMGILNERGHIVGSQSRVGIKQIIQLGFRAPLKSHLNMGLVLEKGASVSLFGIESQSTSKLIGPSAEAAEDVFVYTCEGRVKRPSLLERLKKPKPEIQAPAAGITIG